MSYHDRVINEDNTDKDGFLLYPAALDGQVTVFSPLGAWLRFFVIIFALVVIAGGFFIFVDPISILGTRLYEIQKLSPDTASFPDITVCSHNDEIFSLFTCENPDNSNCSHVWTPYKPKGRNCLTSAFYNKIFANSSTLRDGRKILANFNISQASIEQFTWTGLNVFFHAAGDLPYNASSTHYLSRYALQPGSSLLVTLSITQLEGRVVYNALDNIVYLNRVSMSRNFDVEDDKISGNGVLDIRFATLTLTKQNIENEYKQLWDLASPWAGLLTGLPTVSIFALFFFQFIFSLCCTDCELVPESGTFLGWSTKPPQKRHDSFID